MKISVITNNLWWSVDHRSPRIDLHAQGLQVSSKVMIKTINGQVHIGYWNWEGDDATAYWQTDDGLYPDGKIPHSQVTHWRELPK